MYRSCIFCSAPLGSNESIERFPVGRSLAFDAAKGRLWAVCPKCARWNLAPIHERWEAIDDAERLFRDTRLRVQRENIGLAKLRDGTRLIRVGQALPGELAMWRYGESLVRRRRRYLVGSGIGLTATLGLYGAGLLGLGVSIGAANMLVQGGRFLSERRSLRRVVARLDASETGDGQPATIRWSHASRAVLSTTEDGGELRLTVPDLREITTPTRDPLISKVEPRPVVVEGLSARRLLARSMVRVNAGGARRAWLASAVERLASAPSAEQYVIDTARAKYTLASAGNSPAVRLALEMALHEETERRALHGELAMLEAMWREAEEIAAIADRLPDLPAPQPPRLNAAD